MIDGKPALLLTPQHTRQVSVQLRVGRRVPGCSFERGTRIAEPAIAFERVGETKTRCIPSRAQPQGLVQRLAFLGTVTPQAQNLGAL